MNSSPIRVLLAKVGLDGHDRGVKVVARTLRDAGMDVIYSGLHRTPEEVVNTALQEDVDVLGVSLLSGVQLTVFPKLFGLLAERGGERLDRRAELVDRVEARAVHRRHLQAAPAVLDQEALLLEQAERRHHRLARHRQPRGQLVLRDACAGRERAVADRVEDALVGLLDEGARRLQRFHGADLGS